MIYKNKRDLLLFKVLFLMFSCVKFHNEELSIVETRYVKQHTKEADVVKCKGGKYAAFIISPKKS